MGLSLVISISCRRLLEERTNGEAMAFFDQDYDILYFKTGGNNKGHIMEEIEKGELLYARGE